MKFTITKEYIDSFDFTPIALGTIFLCGVLVLMLLKYIFDIIELYV